MIKVAVLTSSRADYGIYQPLLRKMLADSAIDLHIIAFGTHTSHFHGYTLELIQNDGYVIDYAIDTLLAGDTEEAISTSIALTQMKFASIWAKEKNNYNLVFCLGDRFEMFAAVSAAVPFNIKIAHLHGGETTLGAIDNVFRHSISLFCQYHFTSTREYAKKVSEIIGSDNNIYNVGALSLDNLKDLSLFDKEEFFKVYGINLSQPTVLVTFHPETVATDKNIEYTDELIDALETLGMQTVITMPNADTMGNLMRKKFEAFSKQNERVHCIENFGIKGYLSCIRHCAFLLGNTSSGIIEAASFAKYVINLGDRQKGRSRGPNVIDCNPSKNEIINSVNKVQSAPILDGSNIYWNGGASDKILNIIKKLENES